jgi:lysophospholipase L1-like esterase
MLCCLYSQAPFVAPIRRQGMLCAARNAAAAVLAAVGLTLVTFYVLPQPVFAQEPAVTPQAQEIAARYGADPAMVQRMLDGGVPPELIDLPMIQEQAMAEGQGAPAAARPSPETVPDLALAPAQPLTQAITLEGCSSQLFPNVYLNISVRDNGVPVPGLTQANFVCSENGFAQTDLFSVTPPDASGGVRLADIVFLIDDSGSMDNEIADVRRNVSAFAQTLGGSGVDFRLGLVRFGTSGGPNPYVYNDGNLTADVNQFISFVDTLTASGSYEPGFQALRMAVASFNFRPGAQKVFLLITDEDSDDRNKQATIDLLLANSVTVHTAVDCNAGTSRADYCDASSVRGATGGLQFAIAGPYNQVLDAISIRTASTYVVRYRSSNPLFDGARRNVQCSVTTPAGTGTIGCSYIPGAGPKITLTPATETLRKQTLAEGTRPAISVNVTDVVTPTVQSVTLYYRTTNAAGYASLPMRPAGGDVYSATIPGVSRPGVDFYVRATDGQVTAQLPSVDPGVLPYQIAVLPNVAPTITHEALAVAPSNKDLTISAKVQDTTNKIAAVNIKWRYAGELLFRSVTMASGPDDIYSAVISREQVTQDIEYYVLAADDLGVASSDGTPDKPHAIKVTDFGEMIITLRGTQIVRIGGYARVVATVSKSRIPLPTVKVGFEVINGPNRGVTDLDQRSFCVTYFGWNGPCLPGLNGELVWMYPSGSAQPHSRDEIRAYADINKNNVYDNGEPVTTKILGWYEHISYAALGDSYSSGEGLGTYIDNTDRTGNLCHRSDLAYPRLLKPFPYDRRLPELRGPTIDFFACSGAMTSHIVGNLPELQLQLTGDVGNAKGSSPKGLGELIQNLSLVSTEAKRGVELVTISISGNDTGWTEVLEFCLTTDNCAEVNYTGTVTPTAAWLDQRITLVLSRVRTTLREIKKSAPEATIVLVGYPHPFPKEREQQLCDELADPVTSFIVARNDNWSPEEQNSFRQAADRLNNGLALAASAFGVYFVDPRNSFAGHEICGTQGAFINQLDINWLAARPRDEAFHPSAEGHLIYAALVEEGIKQVIEAGTPLNRAALPINPTPQLAAKEQDSLVAEARSIQLAASAVPQRQWLSSEQTDRICDSVYSSLVGGTVNIAADGFAPSSTISLTLHVAGLGDVEAQRINSDSTGRLQVSVALPQIEFDTVFSIRAVGIAHDGSQLIASTDLLHIFADLPPCGAEDTATTRLNTAIAIDVLANDNPGAAPLDPATLIIRSGPQYGNARVDATTHTVIYEPDLGFFGADSLVYGVCDESGTCSEAVVNMIVDASCTIWGTEDGDTIAGTPGPDVICALGGDDFVDGGEGNDVILGGSGHDALYGGLGDDQVYGDTGENVAAGGDGNDLVVPGSNALLADESETKTPTNINSLLTLSGSSATHDPSAAPNALHGVYFLTATLTNSSAQPLSNLFFRVTTLSENNVILDADGGPSGEGGKLSVPTGALGENGILDPGEALTVVFRIGVMAPRAFTLAFDGFGIVNGATEPLVGGEGDGFRFQIGEDNLRLNRPLYLPAISR